VEAARLVKKLRARNATSHPTMKNLARLSPCQLIKKMSYTLEVCVDSLDSALEAERGGASRIELCAALIEGGCTPSPGLLNCVCRQLSTCKIHVLIRPRGGDFLYTQNEVAVMKQDVLAASAAGAHGCVMGFLTREGDIDTNLTSSFVRLCTSLDLDFTFHRAFDVVRDQFVALEALVACRVGRVLTSGGQPSALQGASRLAELNSEAGNRIIIMPGGGINEENVVTIATCSGATELHGTFRYIVPTQMKFIHPAVTFSLPYLHSERQQQQQHEETGGDGEEERAAWGWHVVDAEVVTRVRRRLTELSAEEEGIMDK